jgi:hypothetical protein
MRNGGQRGRGMADCIILVALIATGALFVVTVFGDNLRTLLGSAASESQDPSCVAEDLGGESDDRAGVERHLENLHEPE